MMLVLSEKEQIKIAIKNFVKLYGENKSYVLDRRNRPVGKELLALDVEKATADDVAEIIGNKAWVSPVECGECKTSTWGIVEIGEEPDYESKTAYLCRGCLERAIKMLDNAEKHD